MKKYHALIILLLIYFPGFPQSSDGFKYQAVIRNSAGNINANAEIVMGISILQGSIDGSAVFSETHNVVSNNFGLVILTIGSQNQDSFALIDWSNGPYFLKIEVGGIEFGTSQLLSVPYALHAKTAESITGTIAETDPLFSASTAANITQTQIDNWTNKLSEFAEVDPHFDVSVAATITQANIENWSNKLDNFIEADPEFAASLAKGISAMDTAYWNSKLDDFVESDPTFLAHPSAGITANDITMWKALWIWYTTNQQGYLKIASPAGGITEADTAKWNSAISSYTETDPRVPQGTATGQLQYWNGTEWVVVEMGSEGQYLSISGGIPSWVTLMEEDDVLNPSTGKIWKEKNLGAMQVATSSTDVNSYGDLYQWGRPGDGHQVRTSATTTTLSASDAPGHANFIITNAGVEDWRDPQNDNLWQGINGVNNPCPAGYRVPTYAEYNAERQSWSSNNAAGALASVLKLPIAGFRRCSDGALENVGIYGSYWSSTISGTEAGYIYFSTSNAIMPYDQRGFGTSIRCIKN